MFSESNSIQVRLKLQSHNFLIDLQLKLPSSGLTTISGHSGSGKTTLLRYIAGLIRPNESDLSVNNVIWHDERTWVPPHLRPIGYVFQEPSLFPHLSVLKNIRYGCPKIKKNIYSIEEISEILGIRSLFERKPYELSGGERQRVAIARALASEPSLLLMDEPLASLDANRKKDILPFIKRLRDELSLPILYVTHSDNEITELGNHHIVIDNGKIAKEGMIS